jgi:hypothetical protein
MPHEYVFHTFYKNVSFLDTKILYLWTILQLHLKIEFLYNSHARAKLSFIKDKLARLFSLSRSVNTHYC